jgi:hypothetical protein
VREPALSRDGKNRHPGRQLPGRAAAARHRPHAHRACQILGGVDELARHLKVSRAMLHAWLEGEDVPPASIFLKAVDLILPTWGPEDDALAKAIAATRPKKN